MTLPFSGEHRRPVRVPPRHDVGVAVADHPHHDRRRLEGQEARHEGRGGPALLQAGLLGYQGIIFL